jgi:threonine dehydratase
MDMPLTGTQPPPTVPCMTTAPTLADIHTAQRRLEAHLHRTPILSSREIDAIAGARLLFKCENFQRTGSFKARGAFNAVLSLPAAKAARGVVTHSSGNHAAALALAAKERRIAAHIVMPHTAPAPKKAAVAAYGGRIVECEPTLAARLAAAEAIMAETGAVLIPPFDSRDVAAGQGSCAMELMTDASEPLDAISCPVGGGGLLAGTLVAVKETSPEILVIAAEPAAADDAARGFRTHVLQPQVLPVATIADGLTTAMSEMTFGVMCARADQVVTASEEAIIEAMRLIWSRMKIIVEPSCAVPLAAILEGRWDANGRTVGVILTGGNVDLDRLPWGR